MAPKKSPFLRARELKLWGSGSRFRLRPLAGAQTTWFWAMEAAPFQTSEPSTREAYNTNNIYYCYYYDTTNNNSSNNKWL